VVDAGRDFGVAWTSIVARAVAGLVASLTSSSG